MRLTNILFDGAPEPIRTVDLPLRRGLLYPAELREQKKRLKI